ncbi:MAG: ATP-binding protein, partial [Pseudomonas sp.]
AQRDMPSSVPLERPVRLAVSDTGPGIAPEAVGRIFDPFFTTRKGGTGLGLALVHRAVEAHQGMILVDGGPQHGAQFTVYLPAQAERRA